MEKSSIITLNKSFKLKRCVRFNLARQDRESFFGKVIISNPDYAMFSIISDELKPDGCLLALTRYIKNSRFDSSTCIRDLILKKVKTKSHFKYTQGLYFGDLIEKVAKEHQYISIYTVSSTKNKFIVAKLIKSSKASLIVKLVDRLGLELESYEIPRSKIFAIEFDNIYLRMLSSLSNVSIRCRRFSARAKERSYKSFRRGAVVEITRANIDNYPIYGIIRDFTNSFIFIESFNNNNELDGFAVISTKYITKCATNYETNLRKLLIKSEFAKPSKLISIDLSSYASLLQVVKKYGPIVLYCEVKNKNSCLVGKLINSDKESITLRLLTPLAKWGKKATIIAIKDITMISFGGQYEQSLYSLAFQKLAPPTLSDL